MRQGLRFARDLMTTDPVVLAAEDPLLTALDVMRLGRIRHLPVLDAAGKVVGIVSDRDLTAGALFRAAGMDEAAEQRLLHRLRVQQVMSRRVHIIAPDTTLTEAATQMNRLKLSCLPVVESGRLLGILTERDFVLAFLGRESAEPEPGTGGDRATLPEDEAGGIEAEFERLRTVRDELRVQLSLASLEARDRFREAERHWQRLEQRIRAAREPGSPPLEDAARIAHNFLEEIRLVYRDLRGKLES